MKTLVNVQEAKVLIETVPDLQIWDTRELIDWRESHLMGAMNMPHSEVIVNINGCGCFTPIKVPKDTPILVYGVAETVLFLEKKGYTNLYFLLDGLEGWKREGLPFLVAGPGGSFIQIN